MAELDVRQEMKILSLLALAIYFLMTATGHSSGIDEATFKGTVFTEAFGETPYVLIITYSSDRSYQKVTKIDLTLGGKTITIPSESYTDLNDLHRPFPLYGVGGEPEQVQFLIEGGDSSKSYRVGFFFDQNQLLRRKVYQTHGGDDEVTVYTTSD